MLRVHSTRPARVVLFDFLAPSLLKVQCKRSRAADFRSASTRRDVASPKPSASSPASPIPRPSKSTNAATNSRIANHQEVTMFNSILVQANGALQRNDVEAFSGAWATLRDDNLLDFLGSSKLDEFARFSSERLLQSSLDKLDPRLLDPLVVASVRGAPNGLFHFMVTLLQNGHVDAVLKLYDMQVELTTTEEENWKDEMTDEITPELDPYFATFAGEVEDHAVPMTSTGIVGVRLTMVAAHAYRKTFTDAMHRCLHFGHRFNYVFVQEFLKHFDKNPDLQAAVKEYVERINTGIFLSQEQHISSVITKYGRDRNLKSLQNLFRRVVTGLSVPFLAMRPGDVGPDRPILIPESTWRSFLSAFLHAGGLDEFRRLWKEYDSMGVGIDIQMFNVVLEGFRETRPLDEVERAWAMIATYGLEPDALSYRALIGAQFHAAQPQRAQQTFRQFMNSPAFAKSDTRALMTVYNSVLNGLLNNKQEREAKGLLDLMSKQGPKPDLVSYNTFLRHHAHKGDLKALADVLRTIASEGLVPDGTTCTTVLNALSKTGTKDAAKRVIGIMQSMGIPQNVVTYSTILNGIVRQGGPSLKEALEFLAHMETLEDARPNVITYTSVLAGFYRDRSISPQELEECTQWILKRMASNRVRPTRTTYGYLLKACLDSQSPKGLEHFLRYYRDLVKHRVELHRKTWYFILKSLTDRKEWAIGREVVEQMAAMNVRLQGIPLKRCPDFIDCFVLFNGQP